MFKQLGVPELLIILVIVILIFGIGKLPSVAKDLGKSIREFKKATTEPDEEEEAEDKHRRKVKRSVKPPAAKAKTEE